MSSRTLDEDLLLITREDVRRTLGNCFVELDDGVTVMLLLTVLTALDDTGDDGEDE